MTNDTKDRHVLAAAVKAKADVIVTFNLKDFPLESVEPFDIKVQHPDNFLLDILSKYGVKPLVEILTQQANALKKPPVSLRELLQRLNRQTPDFYKAVLFILYSDYLLDIAKEAMEQLGITPIIKPIRGGTDGSQLSYMGLPCPNIFAGGHNFHGKYEYVPVGSMEKAVEVVVKICEITSSKF